MEKQEGDICGIDGCTGILAYEKAGECTCHISPPCSACVNANLTCPECGEWFEGDK
jgi:hypothetical protein